VASKKQRKIIHIDADAFYASVEIRENPDLAKLPVAVGGQPSRRGVIATCNYIARQYGVHSAMASSHALKLCPNLIFVKPQFELYRAVSYQIREIMARYTDIIEPLSLDEAYLDVSSSTQFDGSATLIAEAIRKNVQDELSICVSAGVAPNKFLAKIASDWNKPDGICVITPSQVSDFVFTLPVGKINGVGKVTEKKLNNLGIDTCGDLAKFDTEELCKQFGKYGQRLSLLSQGIDDRDVITERIRKSLSVEHTFSKDLTGLEEVISNSQQVYDELCSRLAQFKKKIIITKRYVKVKFNDFSQTTFEESIPAISSFEQQAIDVPAQQALSLDEYKRMLEHAWQRGDKPARLLGLGVRLANQSQDQGKSQLDLFEHNN